MRRRSLSFYAKNEDEFFRDQHRGKRGRIARRSRLESKDNLSVLFSANSSQNFGEKNCKICGRNVKINNINNSNIIISNNISNNSGCVCGICGRSCCEIEGLNSRRCLSNNIICNNTNSVNICNNNDDNEDNDDIDEYGGLCCNKNKNNKNDNKDDNNKKDNIDNNINNNNTIKDRKDTATNNICNICRENICEFCIINITNYNKNELNNNKNIINNINSNININCVGYEIGREGLSSSSPPPTPKTFDSLDDLEIDQLGVNSTYQVAGGEEYDYKNYEYKDYDCDSDNRCKYSNSFNYKNNRDCSGRGYNNNRRYNNNDNNIDIDEEEELLIKLKGLSVSLRKLDREKIINGLTECHKNIVSDYKKLDNKGKTKEKKDNNINISNNIDDNNNNSIDNNIEYRKTIKFNSNNNNIYSNNIINTITNIADNKININNNTIDNNNNILNNISKPSLENKSKASNTNSNIPNTLKVNADLDSSSSSSSSSTEYPKKDNSTSSSKFPVLNQFRSMPFFAKNIFRAFQDKFFPSSKAQQKNKKGKKNEKNLITKTPETSLIVRRGSKNISEFSLYEEEKKKNEKRGRSVNSLPLTENLSFQKNLTKTQGENIKAFITENEFLSKNIDIVDDYMKLLILGLDSESKLTFLNMLLNENFNKDRFGENSIGIEKKIIKLLGHYIKLNLVLDYCQLGYSDMLSVYCTVADGVVAIINAEEVSSAVYAYETLKKACNRRKVGRVPQSMIVLVVIRRSNIRNKDNDSFSDMDYSPESLEKLIPSQTRRISNKIKNELKIKVRPVIVYDLEETNKKQGKSKKSKNSSESNENIENNENLEKIKISENFKNVLNRFLSLSFLKKDLGKEKRGVNVCKKIHCSDSI